MQTPFEIGPYEPCPCGSGEKYKFCCAERNKDKRHGKYPIGTLAFYGPDDVTTTKIAAGIILRDGGDASAMERWVAVDVTQNPKVQAEIKAFFARNGVKTVVAADGNIGCPHEKGVDFPVGQQCPFCPFWSGIQGIASRDRADNDQLGLPEEMDWPAIKARIEEVLGTTERSRAESLQCWFDHLSANLPLPMNVTGDEDFAWEEKYVIGGMDPDEYKRLKKRQPSYEDEYELLKLSMGERSQWMMFPGEDLAAHVRRISDGRMFVMGLSELKACDQSIPSARWMEAFGAWLVNSR